MNLPEKSDLIYIFKQIRPLAPILLFTVVVVLGATFYINYQVRKNASSEFKATVAKQTPPKENYFGANAKVLSVDTVGSTITVESTHSSGWKKTWNLFVSKDTVLATFKSWSQPSSGSNNRPFGQTSPENLEKLSLSSFKQGDIVYVTTADDLAKNTEIKNVSKVLLQ